MTENLFSFEWGVDQDGYLIERMPAGSGRTVLATYSAHEVIRRRGGPLRYYRPMERPGLWRRFAETCRSPSGIVAFANEFGVLADQNEETVDRIAETAKLLDAIGAALDHYNHPAALAIFNAHARPRLTARLVRGPKRFEFELMPLTLRAALWLQAGRAIAGDRQLRRCRNCPEWFEIGTGAGTERKAFCSDRCRVAWNRKHRRLVASLSQ